MYQLHIFFCYRLDFISISPGCCWDFFAWFEPVKSCVFCNSLCEAKCLLFLLCVEETLSCFLLIRSFYFSLPIDPWGWRGDGWWWDLMQDEVLCSQVSSLYIVPLRVSGLFLIYHKKKLLWWELSDTLIYMLYGSSNIPFGIILLFCSFFRIIVVSPKVHDLSILRFL